MHIKKILFIAISLTLLTDAITFAATNEPAYPMASHSKCVCSFNIDETMIHHHVAPPGFIAAREICMEHSCAIAVNTATVKPIHEEYSNYWYPGFYLQPSISLYDYGGAAKTIQWDNDRLYTTANKECDYSHLGGRSSQMCNIENKIIPTLEHVSGERFQYGCAYHFDASQHDLDIMRYGGYQPPYLIYTKDDLDKFYYTDQEHRHDFSGPWYNETVDQLKPKILKLMESVNERSFWSSRCDSFKE